MIFLQLTASSRPELLRSRAKLCLSWVLRVMGDEGDGRCGVPTALQKQREGKRAALILLAQAEQKRSAAKGAGVQHGARRLQRWAGSLKAAPDSGNVQGEARRRAAGARGPELLRRQMSRAVAARLSVHLSVRPHAVHPCP